MLNDLFHDVTVAEWFISGPNAHVPSTGLTVTFCDFVECSRNLESWNQTSPEIEPRTTDGYVSHMFIVTLSFLVLVSYLETVPDV